MSATAGLWALLAVCLCLASLRRPAWSVSLYLMTFFAAPQLWWWGKDLPSLRYAFISGFVLLGAVVLHSSTSAGRPGSSARTASIAALAMIANATFVHFVLAVDRAISLDTYLELLKFVLLYFLMNSSIRDRRDLYVVLTTLALGAGYLGYEVTFNERGTFTAGRLEGVGAPGADTANGLASLLLLVLPLIGSLFVEGTRWHKALVIISAPLVLNVIIMCNSRGAFLGLIGGGVMFLFLARGPTRKRALRTLALGAIALYMLLGDPKILERFQTTFVGAEERDRSAESRLEVWQAGLLMLSDYPLGAGGGTFKFVFSDRYLARVGSEQKARGLHNGYLTDATDWGLQGLVLKIIFIMAAARAAYRTSVQCRLAGRADDALVGISYLGGLTSLMIASVFGSYLSNEWTYWIVALLTRYSEIYAPSGQTVHAAEPVIGGGGAARSRREAVA